MTGKQSTYSTQFTVRFTAAQATALEKAAKEAGITVTDLIRRRATPQELNPMDTLLLGEFLTTSAIILELHTAILRGDELTNDVIRSIVERAQLAQPAMITKRLMNREGANKCLS